MGETGQVSDDLLATTLDDDGNFFASDFDDDGSESGIVNVPTIGQNEDGDGFSNLAFAPTGGALSTETIFQAFAELAGDSVPQRQGLINQALQQNQQLANGSPQAILQSLGPNIQAIQEQLAGVNSSISRRLGPSGGGQIQRDQQQALGAATQGIGRSFAGAQQQGLQGLFSTLSGVNPGFSSSLPQSFTQENKGSPIALGASLAGALGTGAQIFNGGGGGFNSLQPSPFASAQAAAFGSATGGQAVFGPFE